MDAASIGEGSDRDQQDSDSSSEKVKKHSHKRSKSKTKSKSKSRVLEKVGWFTRKSRSSRDEPPDGACAAEAVGANHMDLEVVSISSTSDPSMLSVYPWAESSSSSDNELFDGAQEVKRSRLYPNSEVIEQNCLKPSVARALFLQIEAANLRSGVKMPKHGWRKGKKKHKDALSRSDSLQGHAAEPSSSGSSEEHLARTISMPNEIGIQVGKDTTCHCPACCVCTPSQRLMGACPAHAPLNTSTTSLDTGLQSLMPPCSSSAHLTPPLTPYDSQTGTFVYPCSTLLGSVSSSSKAPMALSNALKNSDSTQTLTWSSPDQSYYGTTLPNLDIFQYKSNSLPMYYGRKCRNCNKPVRSHLPQTEYGHQTSSAAMMCNCSQLMKCTKDCDGESTLKPDRSRHIQKKVDPTEFKRRREILKEWFSEFDDEQKNLVLKELLDQSDLPQIHMLSLELEPRLHEGCPPNCHDMLTWLPQSVAHKILGYLDAVSLCRASSVCLSWYQLANEPSLWRTFCCQPKWRLSCAGEQKQLIQHMLPNENVDWKKVFSERYRLRNNWLRGKCYVRTFEGHTQGISCVQFDDTRIVSGSSDKTIKVWNIRTNSPWSVQTLVGHSGTVRCLHLQGNRLVSGSTDASIKVWDLSTQQSWSSIACKVTMLGHSDTVRCLQVDDDKVISGSYDKTLKLWDIRTGQCKMTLRGHDAAVLCVQFDNTKIVSGSCDKTIKVWQFTGECMVTLHGHHDAVTCLQFDQTRIISGSLDCNLKFWDIHTGQCINTIDWKASEGHTGVVRCLQADSWRVVSASDDRTLKVWSLETGERLVTLRNHTDGVTCLQFNDSIIVSGSYDKTVKLWDFSCC